MTEFIIEEFTPMQRNSLICFAKVRMPSGIIFCDVGIHRSGDGVWASPAGKPMINRDGGVVRDAAGKTRYVPIVMFADNKTRDRWSSSVIDAMRQQHPEAFE